MGTTSTGASYTSSETPCARSTGAAGIVKGDSPPAGHGGHGHTSSTSPSVPTVTFARSECLPICATTVNNDSAAAYDSRAMMQRCAPRQIVLSDTYRDFLKRKNMFDPAALPPPLPPGPVLSVGHTPPSAQTPSRGGMMKSDAPQHSASGYTRNESPAVHRQLPPQPTPVRAPHSIYSDFLSRIAQARRP